MTDGREQCGTIKEHSCISLHGYPCRHCGGAAGRTALRSVQQEAHPGTCSCDRKCFYCWVKSLASLLSTVPTQGNYSTATMNMHLFMFYDQAAAHEVHTDDQVTVMLTGGVYYKSYDLYTQS